VPLEEVVAAEVGAAAAGAAALEAEAEMAAAPMDKRLRQRPTVGAPVLVGTVVARLRRVLTGRMALSNTPRRTTS
jgi:hypothetical protein